MHKTQKKILKEFKVGDSLLTGLGHAITIYGSARTKRSNKYFQATVELTDKLYQEGFNTNCK